MEDSDRGLIAKRPHPNPLLKGEGSDNFLVAQTFLSVIEDNDRGLIAVFFLSSQPLTANFNFTLQFHFVRQALSYIGEGERSRGEDTSGVRTPIFKFIFTFIIYCLNLI